MIDNIDVVEVLKVGLTGFFFLLTLLSFLLLAKEQKLHPPRPHILGYIKFYMLTNVFLSTLAATTLIINIYSNSKPPQLSKSIEDIKVVASNSAMNQGVAAACIDAEYYNKYLLLRNTLNNELVQVYTKNPIPCPSGQEHIVIGEIDAAKLGWEAINNKANIAVAIATPGFMFVTSTLN